MAYVTKVNSGNFFKNNDPDQKAHYSGEANVEGVLYFVDAYVNEGNKGKYFSYKFKRKNKQEGAEQPVKEIFEEDVPL